MIQVDWEKNIFPNVFKNLKIEFYSIYKNFKTLQLGGQRLLVDE